MFICWEGCFIAQEILTCAEVLITVQLQSSNVTSEKTFSYLHWLRSFLLSILFLIFFLVLNILCSLISSNLYWYKEIWFLNHICGFHMSVSHLWNSMSRIPQCHLVYSLMYSQVMPPGYTLAINPMAQHLSCLVHFLPLSYLKVLPLLVLCHGSLITELHSTILSVPAPSTLFIRWFSESPFVLVPVFLTLYNCITCCKWVHWRWKGTKKVFRAIFNILCCFLNGLNSYNS